MKSADRLRAGTDHTHTNILTRNDGSSFSITNKCREEFKTANVLSVPGALNSRNVPKVTFKGTCS